MADKAWKQAERRFAALFGTKRRPLSGGNFGTGERDDAFHPKLFLECKQRKSHALWELYKKCRDMAAKEKQGRVPVIGLSQKNHPGFLLVIHEDDLFTVYQEHSKAYSAFFEQEIKTLDKRNDKKFRPLRKKKCSTSKTPKRVGITEKSKKLIKAVRSVRSARRETR